MVTLMRWHRVGTRWRACLVAVNQMAIEREQKDLDTLPDGESTRLHIQTNAFQCFRHIAISRSTKPCSAEKAMRTRWHVHWSGTGCRRISLHQCINVHNVSSSAVCDRVVSNDWFWACNLVSFRVRVRIAAPIVVFRSERAVSLAYTCYVFVSRIIFWNHTAYCQRHSCQCQSGFVSFVCILLNIAYNALFVLLRVAQPVYYIASLDE